MAQSVQQVRTQAGRVKKAQVANLPGAGVPTLKEQGMDVEALNWRAIMAAPGTTAEQRDAPIKTMAGMVATTEWAGVLKARGGDNACLARAGRRADPCALIARAARAR